MSFNFMPFVNVEISGKFSLKQLLAELRTELCEQIE